LKRLLAKTRLLTLIGSGGCGKTRLSLQLAADSLEQFPDGVWLVELAPLSDPALIEHNAALKYVFEFFGFSSREHFLWALAAGFDDYGTKPIQFDNFLAQLDRLAAVRSPGGQA